MQGFGTFTAVQGQGYLGNAPDLRYTAAGVPVCTMDAGVGNGAHVAWFRITSWKGLALACSKLQKGDPVGFDGSLRVRVTGEEGNVRKYTDIVATKVGVFRSPTIVNWLVPEKWETDKKAFGDESLNSQNIEDVPPSLPASVAEPQEELPF